MSAIQYWHVENEIDLVEEFPQPGERFVPNRQWWCSHCGRIWARVVYDGIETKDVWKGSWQMEARRCTECGAGDLLDVAVISHIIPLPIPTAIFEREIRRHLERQE